MDYESDMTIDETGLDVEWLSQPKLMMDYGIHAADMRKRVDQAKEKMEVVRAELDREIRESPDLFGIVKITETVVANTIITAEAYQQASTTFIEAKYELDMAMTAVRAVDQRKAALENLVRLHGQQYFAGPQVPRDLSKEWEQKQRQRNVDAGVAKAMRRRTK